MDFSDCKKKVATAFSDLDLRDIVKFDKKGEEEDNKDVELVEEPRDRSRSGPDKLMQRQLWR